MASYIYKIVDPRTDRPFYVGKTGNPDQRFKCHNSYKKGDLGKRIQEIRSEGHRLKFIVIEKVEDYWIITERERFWIDKLNSDGENLFNVINWNMGKDSKGAYDVVFECDK